MRRSRQSPGDDLDHLVEAPVTLEAADVREVDRDPDRRKPLSGAQLLEPPVENAVGRDAELVGNFLRRRHEGPPQELVNGAPDDPSIVLELAADEIPRSG